MADPRPYINADLANQGECVVCAKMGGQKVAGDEKYRSIHKGNLYLFPSDKERRMFEANPEAYLGDRPAMKETAAAASEVNVVGTTACAHCAYGVTPISDPGSMGIAIDSGETIYVVEGGEKRYPKLYADRFDEVKVRLQGAVKKKERNFVWIEPKSITMAD